MLKSVEKYQKALSLEPYADRTEMPVYPQINAAAGSLGGKTQAEIFFDAEAWLEALDATYALIGKPDMGFAEAPGDGAFGMAMVCRAPGRDLGENELYQFIETPYIQDSAEYKVINEMGYGAWRVKYLMDIQTPPMTDPGQLFAKFGEVGRNSAKVREFYAKRDIEISAHAATMPIFDTLSLDRTMMEFTCDLYEDPGPIMDIIANYQEEETVNTIKRLRDSHGERVAIFAMRSSSAFLSPDAFDEYAWPALKRMIETFHAAGIMVVLHADSNWVPMLDRLIQLPKKSVHVELDEENDIFAAYEILRGWHSIRGNVPAGLFAFGTPDDICSYCEPLVEMGMSGGFILGSSCDIPLNAKPENVKAMIDMVR